MLRHTRFTSQTALFAGECLRVVMQSQINRFCSVLFILYFFSIMPKRKCKFTDDLQREFSYLRDQGHGKLLCNICLSVFSISHGGRSDVKDHLATKKHKASIEAAASSSCVTSFFKTTGTNAALAIAAKEATFAYHTATHGQSFKSSDCTSKLVSKLFEPKFSLGKTKCESIVVNVIAPMSTDELRKELDLVNFVTVTIDASNRKEVKLVPIVVRYFLPETGVKVKLLQFKSVPGETAAILSEYLLSVLDRTGLKEKLIGFCADNCNTNFGGIKRRGQKNVFFKVKENLKRNIVGIGCAVHIVHNCLQHAVDTLPVCVESLVVKIYKFFYIYTVRVSELKEFCEFVDVEYKRVLQHGNTRFLSLLPALQRILEMFEALKSYFKSQERCPTIISKCFTEPAQELYLTFVHGELEYFNKIMLKMERQKTSAVDVANIFMELKFNLHEKKVNNFVPYRAKCLLEKLEKEGEIDVRVFLTEVRDFYEKCESYLNGYSDIYEDVVPHLWMNLSEDLSWPLIRGSAENINKMFQKQMINVDFLFDEHVLVKKYMSERERNKESWKNASLEQKWTQLFQIFSNKSINIPNFQKLVEFVLCLPGTSAPVERIFSIMNNMWSDDRGQMLEQNVKALLTCKINVDLTCTEFYEKIRSNTVLLKKVLSTEKYHTTS
ncbi:uncharacterized protein LOC144750537 [Ciona intestinalis]